MDFDGEQKICTEIDNGDNHSGVSSQEKIPMMQ